jgi:hypothetical protein
MMSLSVSYPSIAPCLHYLIRHDTSLTTIPIPQSIMANDTILTHITYCRYPTDGLIELANLYHLRGKIAYEASTRCASIEFPFHIDGMSTYVLCSMFYVLPSFSCL